MALQIEYHPGAAVCGILQRMRRECAAAGTSPFMVGGDVGDIEAAEKEHLPALAATLEAAAAWDWRAWLADRHRKLAAEGGEDDAASLLGEWPGDLPKMGPTTHLDMRSQKPRPSVAIARLAVAQSWMIPAALGYGGWNDCPDAIALCAIGRHWAELYDADIIGLSHSVLEWEIRKPPRTREQAMVLAHEQYLVCTDIVTQGVETISNLGGNLLNANNWYFWWD